MYDVAYVNLVKHDAAYAIENSMEDFEYQTRYSTLMNKTKLEAPLTREVSEVIHCFRHHILPISRGHTE